MFMSLCNFSHLKWEYNGAIKKLIIQVDTHLNSIIIYNKYDSVYNKENLESRKQTNKYGGGDRAALT